VHLSDTLQKKPRPEKPRDKSDSAHPHSPKARKKSPDP
jgi:hypothetical protein